MYVSVVAAISDMSALLIGRVIATLLEVMTVDIAAKIWFLWDLAPLWSSYVLSIAHCDLFGSTCLILTSGKQNCLFLTDIIHSCGHEMGHTHATVSACGMK